MFHERLAKDNEPALKLDIDQDTGKIIFEGLTNENDEPDLAPIYAHLEIDPNRYRIAGDLKFSLWDAPYKEKSIDENGETVEEMKCAQRKAFKGTLVPIADHHLTAEEYEQLLVKGERTAYPDVEDDDYTRVVMLGDLQIGKADVYGGTAELAERVVDVCAKLESIFEREPAHTIVHLDTGDVIESFNNTASQAYTNDLSAPEQLKVARRTMYHIFGMERQWCKNHHVASTPSNHGAWRKGRDYLGRPGDDFGIDVIEAIKEGYEVAGFDTQFHLPKMFRMFTTIDVNGHRMALTHGGDPKGSGKNIMQWWKNQQFNHPDELLGTTIYANGHWHSPVIEGVGEGIYRIQSPAMDGGSAWFTNGMVGSGSLPGAVTFRICPRGTIRDVQIITTLRGGEND